MRPTRERVTVKGEVFSVAKRMDAEVIVDGSSRIWRSTVESMQPAEKPSRRAGLRPPHLQHAHTRSTLRFERCYIVRKQCAIESAVGVGGPPDQNFQGRVECLQ